MKEKNPFAPEVERVPFKLLLDAFSFQHLRGEDRQKAEFLCELCWTPALDALWSWEGEPIMSGIPRTELRPLRGDDRAVGLVGQPGGFIGGIRIWSQFDRWADENGYEGTERDWFIYYGSLAYFADRSDRHFLVTADRRLLKESAGEKGWFRKGRHRIIPIGRALFLAGLAMKAHGEVFYESPQPRHTVWTTSYSMYDYLARDLISARRRLFDCMHEEGESKDDFYRTEREGLCVSVFDRTSDLLRARDRVALVNARHQDGATLDEILYELRAMIGNAAGVFDAIAVLAQIAFLLGFNSQSGDAAISLRRPEFRKALRGAGAAKLASETARQLPFLHFLWSLRNPILHREGLSGYTLHTLGSGRSSKIVLSQKQTGLLKSVCGHRGESPQRWGLDDAQIAGIEPSVEPMAFSHQFTVATIGAVDQLVSALADDRGTPPLATSWSPDERRAIRRFRWLSGLPRSSDLDQPAVTDRGS
jgi:hypothetical protein